LKKAQKSQHPVQSRIDIDIPQNSSETDIFLLLALKSKQTIKKFAGMELENKDKIPTHLPSLFSSLLKICYI